MVRLNSVTKTWGGKPAVRDFSLNVSRGEYVAVVGPSGCGKTTLLRMIAGFDEPDRGEIWLGDKRANCPRASLAPHQRGIGMVFQNLALWPHLTVEEHLKYMLRSRLPKRDQASEIDRLLSLVSLQAKRLKYPGQMSGGEQQRLALIRAIACSQELLLLDEPMNSLDRQSRSHTMAELRELHSRLRMTVLHVTHDWRDIRGLANRVVELESGSVTREVSAPAYFAERREEELVP